MFDFGRQNSGRAFFIYFFFIYFFFGGSRKTAAELLIADGLPSIEKSQEGVDLTRRQGIDDFMKSVQVAHDLLHRRALRLQYIEGHAESTPFELS